MIDISEVLRVSSEQKASDVYLKVGIAPRMRKDGKLLALDFPALVSGDILDCVLKIMEEEQREKLEETGEFCFSYHVPSVGRYRVSVYKSRSAVSMVFHRVWPIEDIVKEFAIPETVRELSDIEQGLIVFAGDSGSGRTTGMAALIDAINEKHPVHIMTMENPIEVIHESKKALIDQREAGTDYADAVYGLSCGEKHSIDALVYEDTKSADALEHICKIAEAGKRVILSANGNSVLDVVEGLTVLFPVSERNSIRKRLSGVLQAIVISGQDCEGDFKQTYDVIRMDDGMRNRICYGK